MSESLRGLSGLTLIFGLAGLTALGAVLLWPPATQARRVTVNFSDEIAIAKPAKAAQTNPVPTPGQLAGPHLTWAERESERRLEEHLAAIDDFFRDVKRRTPEFSKQALGFGSKWRLLTDYVPFTRGDRHEQFLKAKFEELLFTAAQLETLITQTINGYLDEMRSLENEMLVRTRVSAGEFPANYRIAAWDEKQLRAEFQKALQSAIAESNKDFSFFAANQVASLIAGEVLTQVAVRMGVSAGVLGTGAAASPYTLGIGIVVGVIVDQIIEWTYDWAADPKGALTAELNAKLDEIRGFIVNGAGEQPGLRERLKLYAHQRARLREKAVLELLRNDALPAAQAAK